MKSFKRALALVLSLVMLVSTMSLTAFAADASKGPLSLKDAVVKTKTVKFNNKKQTAEIESVTLNGKTLVEGKDFAVVKLEKKNSGTYTVTIKGLGDYVNSEATGTWTIEANATGAKAKKTTVASTIKKAKTTLKAPKKKKTVTVGTFVKKTKKNKAKITYTVKKVKKGNKATAKSIKVKVDAKGKLKVTIPKNAKKGTYKITVKVPAYNYYKGVSKKFNITIK